MKVLNCLLFLFIILNSCVSSLRSEKILLTEKNNVLKNDEASNIIVSNFSELLIDVSDLRSYDFKTISLVVKGVQYYGDVSHGRDTISLSEVNFVGVQEDALRSSLNHVDLFVVALGNRKLDDGVNKFYPFYVTNIVRK